MAYPPQSGDLPVNSTNDTGMQDYHPNLHNVTNSALLDVVSELGPDPSTGNSAVAFNTVQQRLDYIQSFIGTGGPPGGAAGAGGGALSGVYPDPDLKTNYITATYLSSTIKDGAAGSPSLRSLGTGAQQACAGSDARLTNARTPTGAAGGALAGTFPSPTIAPGAITDSAIAAANKDGVAGTPSLRTLGTGAQQAVAGTDGRLSDARTPTGTAAGSLRGTYPNPSLALESAWTAVTGSAGTVVWTASVANPTLGNGFLECRYILAGKMFSFQYILSWGTTTAAGSGHWRFSLPKDPVRGQLATPVGGGTLTRQIVTAYAFSNAVGAAYGTPYYAGVAQIDGGATNLGVILGGTPAALVNEKANTPFTWQTSDLLVMSGVIEVA